MFNLSPEARRGWMIIFVMGLLLLGLALAAVSPAFSQSAAPVVCLTMEQQETRTRQAHRGHKVWHYGVHSGDTSVTYAYIPTGTYGLVFVYHRKCQTGWARVHPIFIKRIMGDKAWKEFHATKPSPKPAREIKL